MACHLSKLKIQEIGNLLETLIQDKNVSTQKEIMGVVLHIEIRSLHAQLLCNANSCLNFRCFECNKSLPDPNQPKIPYTGKHHQGFINIW